MNIVLKSDIDVELIQYCGGDHMVVAAARVSHSPEDARRQADNTDDENFGLINYLSKHRHGTPFEHGSMTFFVRAPIFVWREWHRHRIGFSYNEESGRYKKLDPVFYAPDDNRPMMKVEGWKPGRPRFTVPDNRVPNDIRCSLLNCYKIAYQAYLENLDLNVDPGLARDCLPVGIYSSCWVTCNPRSLMAFLSLRQHHADADRVSYPLYEINMAANKLEKEFGKLWPLTHRAYVDNGRVAP